MDSLNVYLQLHSTGALIPLKDVIGQLNPKVLFLDYFKLK